MTIRDKLLHAIERYDLIAPGDRVLVAVSGGQDSVTLALLLAELAEQLQISLVIGHLHHGLRGEEGDADQACVAALAQGLGLDFVTEQADVGALAAETGCGLEEAGRIARYAFFERAAREHQCSKTALGHTGTDRAETLLMNLFRGSGVYGLRSIPPRRDSIIRPLILVSRQDTGDFCRSCNIIACHDACNADRRFLRNRVRADLLPHLEHEYGPGIEAALCRAADSLWDEVEWTEPIVTEAFQGALTGRGDALSVPALRAMPAGLKHRVLRRFLHHVGFGHGDIGSERWAALEELTNRAQTGRKLELSLGRCVQLEYDSLKVSRHEEGPPPAQPVRFGVPGEAIAPSGAMVEARLESAPEALPAATELLAVLDARRAGNELIVRYPEPGDRFTPLGMTGSKKLQDFFTDNKTPARERHPLLVTNMNGEILWVVGHRLAETAKVDDKTSEYLILSVTPEIVGGADCPKQ
ncbi:MAG: tRNA lysidine(34) synthetase TilS [Bacteroidota bacterium]